jgi:hypothetical protein
MGSDDEEKSRNIHLVDPPRPVPLLVQLSTVLGGMGTQIGSALIAFGMIFLVVLGLRSEAVTYLQFRGPSTIVQGEVLRVEQTSSSESDKEIIAVHYRYDIDGSSLTGTSYTMDPPSKPGTTVPVEVLNRDPWQSRIKGLRVRPFGVGGAVTGLFPLIGLVVVAVWGVQGVRVCRLLRHGRVARAKIILRESTRMHVNDEPVVKFTFEFSIRASNNLFGYRESPEGELRTVRFSHRTHETLPLEDEAEEPILYDPNRPQNACPIDALPSRIVVDDEGRLHPGGGAVRVLVLPALSLVVIAASTTWFLLA